MFFVHKLEMAWNYLNLCSCSKIRRPLIVSSGPVMSEAVDSDWPYQAVHIISIEYSTANEPGVHNFVIDYHFMSAHDFANQSNGNELKPAKGYWRCWLFIQCEKRSLHSNDLLMREHKKRFYRYRLTKICIEAKAFGPLHLKHVMNYAWCYLRTYSIIVRSKCELKMNHISGSNSTRCAAKAALMVMLWAIAGMHWEYPWQWNVMPRIMKCSPEPLSCSSAKWNAMNVCMNSVRRQKKHTFSRDQNHVANPIREQCSAQRHFCRGNSAWDVSCVCACVCVWNIFQLIVLFSLFACTLTRVMSSCLSHCRQNSVNDTQSTSPSSLTICL